MLNRLPKKLVPAPEMTIPQVHTHIDLVKNHPKTTNFEFEYCTHVILSDDKEAKNGLEFLREMCIRKDNTPGILYLPEKIYIHSANPIGRSQLQWFVRDMQRKYDREWPEAFR